jgi:hypothetical protein
MALNYSAMNKKANTEEEIATQASEDYVSVSSVQKKIDKIGDVDVFRGSDFAGFIYFDSTAEISTIKLTVYTDDSVGLVYSTVDGFTYDDGGIELNGTCLSVLIPTDKLDELPDGVIRYEMNVGFKNLEFNDSEQNVILVGKFNAILKTLKYDPDGE